MASKMNGNKRVSVVFFGDGAADEGVLYESINFAMLKTLPVIYVLENNHWSVCSHISARKAGENIFHQASPDLLLARKIDGNDVIAVNQTAFEVVERARRGLGPSFIECETYRMLGHAGCASQDPEGYRDRTEVEEWKKKCPVDNFRDTLLAEETLTPINIAGMEKKIETEIEEAFAFAMQSPLPEGKEIGNHLYCE
jgi:pyruvate dehydrogenase E1 component alpha subunit